MDADQRELLEERIAIMVIDGGLTPAEAERQARACVVRTEPAYEPEQLNLIEPEYKQHLRDFYRKR